MGYKTEQEDFWCGEFGDNYTDRNQGERLIASNISFFSRIINRMQPIDSFIEFGSNIGMNIHAIKKLLPSLGKWDAVEINKKAVEILKSALPDVEVHNQSILEYDNEEKFDFVLCAGVLIHINPDELNGVYEKLYTASKKYVCIVVYYNPTPVMVEYRGEKNKLFKRDFAGEMMDKYPDLKLVDYGFVYHRDAHFPADDSTWFLMEKTN